MRIFDTDVQKLKYMVLREVSRRAFDDRLTDCYLEIPKLIAPGPRPTMRCCVYKERAIAQERVRLAMGGDRDDRCVIEVIPIACDECPVSGYVVSDACRGCLAHRCEAACPREAITFDARQKARIHPEKCVGCGKCSAVCPYSAIQKHTRPCENACKVKAISMGAQGVALIDRAKCTACGACVYQCPFGAISDKSYLLDVIAMLRRRARDAGTGRMYALLAPAAAGQFGARLGQVAAALRHFGFDCVLEAALGADMTAWQEAEELAGRGFMMSACCPAFVSLIEGQFPRLAADMSRTPSPMALLAARVKQKEADARVVFIGPCTAKKAEARRPEVAPYVDAVLTFEELQALMDSRDFDSQQLPPEPLDDASFYGRVFARSGGLTLAVERALAEQGSDFIMKAAVCNGIEACRAALLKAQRGALGANFIEGMACPGGCVGGAGGLTHGQCNAAQIDQHGRQARHGDIASALRTAEAKRAL